MPHLLGQNRSGAALGTTGSGDSRSGASSSLSPSQPRGASAWTGEDRPLPCRSERCIDHISVNSPRTRERLYIVNSKNTRSHARPRVQHGVLASGRNEDQPGQDQVRVAYGRGLSTWGGGRYFPPRKALVFRGGKVAGVAGGPMSLPPIKLTLFFDSPSKWEPDNVREPCTCRFEL